MIRSLEASLISKVLNWDVFENEHFFFQKNSVSYISFRFKARKFLIFKHLRFNEVFYSQFLFTDVTWYSLHVVTYAVVKTDTQNWSTFFQKKTSIKLHFLKIKKQSHKFSFLEKN